MALGLLVMWLSPAVAQHHISLVQINAQVLKNTKAEDTAKALPKVETVLANSTKTFDGILKQTNLLESALMQKQGEFRAQLAKLKEQYEAKLDEQNKQNNEIKSDIARVTESVKKTRGSNAVLRKSSTEIQHNNSMLRIQLQKLEAKLQTAKTFASLTLNSTDDTSSSELEVLNTPKPVRRQEPRPNALAALDSYDTVEQAMDYMVYGHHGRKPEADEDADDGAEPMALLQLSSALGAQAELSYPQAWRAQFPEKQNDKDTSKVNQAASQVQTSAVSLLSVLSNGLAEVESEYRKGVESLQKAFQENFDAGSKRRLMMLARKERASLRLESLVAVNSKLKSANAALLKTQKQLGQRIKGLKMFLAQLSGSAEE